MHITNVIANIDTETLCNKNIFTICRNIPPKGIKYITLFMLNTDFIKYCDLKWYIETVFYRRSFANLNILAYKNNINVQNIYSFLVKDDGVYL